MSGYDDEELKAAYNEGYRDYLKNVAKLDCQYDDLELKAAWLDGWCDANDDEDDK
jgi:ribosome modulation factor